MCFTHAAGAHMRCGSKGDARAGRGRTIGDRKRRPRSVKSTTHASKTRISCDFNGSVARSLASLVRQDKPLRKCRRAPRAHGCCHCRQLAVRPSTFLRAGTKDGAKSGCPARCPSNWQPQSRDGAGRDTGRLLGGRMGRIGTATAF